MNRNRPIFSKLRDALTLNTEIRGIFLGFEVPKDSSSPICVDEIRAALSYSIVVLNDGASQLETASVTDEVVRSDNGELPIWIYDANVRQNAVRHVIVCFHGGGSVAGDLETADSGCRALAASLECRVVSVHYHQPPESPFPAAFEDCVAVVQNVERRKTTRRIVAAGESAGGDVAAEIELGLRDPESKGARPSLDQSAIGCGEGVRVASSVRSRV